MCYRRVRSQWVLGASVPCCWPHSHLDCLPLPITFLQSRRTDAANENAGFASKTYYANNHTKRSGNPPAKSRGPRRALGDVTNRGSNFAPVRRCAALCGASHRHTLPHATPRPSMVVVLPVAARGGRCAGCARGCADVVWPLANVYLHVDVVFPSSVRQGCHHNHRAEG